MVLPFEFKARTGPFPISNGIAIPLPEFNKSRNQIYLEIPTINLFLKMLVLIVIKNRI
jgi:hypothetical protein